MEKEKTKAEPIREYHQKVWRAAKLDTESYFKSDKWAWVGSIITGIATGLYTTILFRVWSVEANVSINCLHHWYPSWDCLWFGVVYSYTLWSSWFRS